MKDGEERHDGKRICSEDGSHIYDRNQVAQNWDRAWGVYRRGHAEVGHLAHTGIGHGDENAEVGAEAETGKEKEIDPLALPSVAIFEKHRLPTCSGIYFVIEADSEVIYIGQSTNIRNRWRGVQHKVYRRFADRLFVRIAWLELAPNYRGLIRRHGYMYLDQLEKRLIMRFNPRLNGAPDKPTRKGAGK